MLPSLSGCSHQKWKREQTVGVGSTIPILERWKRACGGCKPVFKKWDSCDSKDKFELLYGPALTASEEVDFDVYTTAYANVPIEEVMSATGWGDKHSVEHVVPRSHVAGSDAHEAEDDPNGWIVATRSSNSTRSNHPLYLWFESSSRVPLTKFVYYNVAHFLVPEENRARVARKWLYIRATYSDSGALQPMSEAQREHFSRIVTLVMTCPPSDVERAVDTKLREKFGWSNPLIHSTNPNEWLGNPEWRSLIV